GSQMPCITGRRLPHSMTPGAGPNMPLYAPAVTPTPARPEQSVTALAPLPAQCSNRARSLHPPGKPQSQLDKRWEVPPMHEEPGHRLAMQPLMKPIVQPTNADHPGRFHAHLFCHEERHSVVQRVCLGRRLDHARPRAARHGSVAPVTTSDWLSADQFRALDTLSPLDFADLRWW